jgi:hypothetical protein
VLESDRLYSRKKKKEQERSVMQAAALCLEISQATELGHRQTPIKVALEVISTHPSHHSFGHVPEL